MAFLQQQFYRIKDGVDIVTSQTERRIVSTTVMQVTTVIIVKT